MGLLFNIRLTGIFANSKQLNMRLVNHLYIIIVAIVFSCCSQYSEYDFYPTTIGDPYLIGADTNKIIYALGIDYSKSYTKDSLHIFKWRHIEPFRGKELKVWVISHNNIILDYGFDNKPNYTNTKKVSGNIKYPELEFGFDTLMCNGTAFPLNRISVDDLTERIGMYSRTEGNSVFSDECNIYIWDDLGLTVRSVDGNSNRIEAMKIYFTSGFRHHQVVDKADFLIKTMRVVAKIMDQEVQTGKEPPSIVPDFDLIARDLREAPKYNYKGELTIYGQSLGIGCNFLENKLGWQLDNPGRSDPGIIGRALGDGPSPAHYDCYKMDNVNVVYWLHMLYDKQNPYQEVQRLHVWNSR